MIRPRQIYPNQASARHPAVAHLFSTASSPNDSRDSSREEVSNRTGGSDSPPAEAEESTLRSITPYDEIWYCGYPVRP